MFMYIYIYIYIILTPNTTSALQYMEEGVIHSFKASGPKIIDAIDRTKPLPRVSMLGSTKMLVLVLMLVLMLRIRLLPRL